MKLGGYSTVLNFKNLKNCNEFLSELGKNCLVRVILTDQTNNKIKAMLTNITDHFAMINLFLAWKLKGLLGEFALNQLSIEDIFVDMFV